MSTPRRIPPDYTIADTTRADINAIRALPHGIEEPVMQEIQKLQWKLDDALARIYDYDVEIRSQQKRLQKAKGPTKDIEDDIADMEARRIKWSKIATDLSAELDKIDPNRNRATGRLAPHEPTQSAIFPGLKAGKQTRRKQRKNRNGPARIRKHKTRRLLQRQRSS